MNFSELNEFEKDFKHLAKKYRSLPDDIARLKRVLEVIPLGTSKHFAILFQNEEVKVAKARFFCQSLKKDTLRIIYAYHKNKALIIFIQIYHKGDKEREDQRRIRDYLKSSYSSQ